VLFYFVLFAFGDICFAILACGDIYFVLLASWYYAFGVIMPSR